MTSAPDPRPSPMVEPVPAAAMLAERYAAVRSATERLQEPLSAEDCGLQSMTEASPTRWHLAHTTWFWETFVLAAADPGYTPFHPAFRYLFNSYYQGVGAQYPRERRGLVSRPDLVEVLRYRRHVDAAMLRLLGGGEDRLGGLAGVVRVGLAHEQQHQELILTDIKHAFSYNPLHPAYREVTEPPRGEASPMGWCRHEGGIRRIGHDGAGFAFDNERPRHEVIVRPFEIARRPVTNREYLGFIEDGGYENPLLWLSDAWEAVVCGRWRAPLYWVGDARRMRMHTLSGLREVDPEAPVTHVSFYEADAYARWAGCRLPSEAEWEAAAAADPLDGRFADDGFLHPRAAEPHGDGAPAQMYGDVWEWTGSPYVPYPGYRPPSGPVGEYNGKFMCNQMVLRGGSCVTPRGHVRRTYRNFFPPPARWQFSGIRLARDA